MSDLIRTNENDKQLCKAKATEYLDLLGITRKLSPAQKDMFIEMCSHMQLNPLLREIYVVPYNEKSGGVTLTIMVSYQEFIKRAERTGMLNSWHVDIVGEPPSKSTGGHSNMKAVITIWRKDWTNPFVHEVWWDEYAQSGGVWVSKPRTMLRKVAIAQGFRLAFPCEICAGVYGAEEVGTNNTVDAEATVVLPQKEDVKPKTSSVNDEVRKELRTALERAGLNTSQMAEFAAFYALDLKTNLEHAQTVQKWLSNGEILDEKIDKFLDSLSLPPDETVETLEDYERSGEPGAVRTADELF